MTSQNAADASLSRPGEKEGINLENGASGGID